MSQPRPFSALQIGLGSGVINALINAPLGLLLVKRGAVLPLWGVPGVAADLVAMAYGISFGTGLAVSWQMREQRRQGRMLPPALPPRVRAHLAGWPRSLLHRAINLGLASVPVFVPLPLLLLWGSGFAGADQTTLIVLKAVFSFVQGALVTPIVAAAALLPEPPAADA